MITLSLRKENKMTKKAMEKANYVNISKKKRKELAKANRKDTFEGYRPTFFKDKTKYNRQKYKKFEY